MCAWGGARSPQVFNEVTVGQFLQENEILTILAINVRHVFVGIHITVPTRSAKNTPTNPCCCTLNLVKKKIC